MIMWGQITATSARCTATGISPLDRSWTPVAAADAPNALHHTAVWTGTEMIVWGGLNYPTYDLSGGRYNPATDSWTPTSLENAPSLRWLHAAVWTGTEMIVAAGASGSVGGGRYRPATDTWLPISSVNSADNGEGITAVWTGTEMIVWGGLDWQGLFHYDAAATTRHRRVAAPEHHNAPSRGMHAAVGAAPR
jgi:hypothetical protein